MKMVVVVGPHNREQEIRDALRAHGAASFTEIPEVLRQGQTSATLGTSAFPGSSRLIFGMVEDDQMPAVVSALLELKANLFPAERLHACAIPAESLL